MTKPQVAEDPNVPGNRVCEPLTSGVIILGIDFRSKRRERVYNADKVWSGQHTVMDYTEI